MDRLSFLVFNFFLLLSSANGAERPNIIVIVADDLGWNDVSFHGSNQIPTPNLDALAYDGVILHNYYVDPICTPSRSALMTGMHPIHTGLQCGVIRVGEPSGLPLKLKILPQFLNQLNYSSHAIGKWHLGMYRKEFTPTMRGFKSHVGYWGGKEDYFDHSNLEKAGWGYDFRRDMNVSWADYGSYATDLFTKEATDLIKHHDPKSSPLFLYLAHLAVHSANSYAPLQAPKADIDRFNETIADKDRRTFAAMLHRLDEGVGKVVNGLREKGMLENSVIVFTTDNGGPAAGFDLNHASNWPLRGTKDTLWEGGVRGAGFVWSPLLKKNARVSNQMMNIQDWLPTLYAAAGGKASDLPSMDGLNMWESLSEDSASPRNLMLHNYDVKRNIQAVRVGDWKYMKGNTYKGKWDGHYGPSGRNDTMYSIAEVLNSTVAHALAAINRTLPADKVTLEQLRGQTELNCGAIEGDVTPCIPSQSVCLFNVTDDPCERNNLAFKYPDAVLLLEQTLAMYRASAIPPGNKKIDPRADPKYFGYTWTNWLDYVEPLNASWTARDLEEDQIETRPKKEMFDPQIQLKVEQIQMENMKRREEMQNNNLFDMGKEELQVDVSII